MDKPIDHRNVIDDFKGLSTDRIRALYNERALPFIVGVESLKGTLNLGTISRSANCFGAERVIYFGRKKFDARSFVGAHHHFPVEFRDLSFIEMLRDRYTIIGIDNNLKEQCSEYTNFQYPKKTLFLFGSEETGLSKEAKDLCDCFVYIQQLGSVRSLNCSVAASIIMSDYVRKNNVQ